VRLVFTPHGWEDYTYWLSAGRTLLKRINRLIDDALRDSERSSRLVGTGRGLSAQSRRSGAILRPLASVFGALVMRAFCRRLWDASTPGVMGE
jgi:hypothetical protein